ncbi:MAG: DEAD/DEAH box helicase [Deltaproteobacteria bacterium]|nr:DEAD/DEAH box helicase [Deltaproteobacteria bacterium]
MSTESKNMARTVKSIQLTLKDKLSRLSFEQAKKLLGSSGDRLITAGGQFDIDIESQVKLTAKRFSLKLSGATATIRLSDGARSRLELSCNQCNEKCVHMGAALSLILEEKMTLGLSAIRPEEVILGALSEAELVEKALADREKRAKEESLRVTSMDTSQVWTDYVVTNKSSGKAWRVALRDLTRGGASYCSCPDFKKNTLGTCKHLIKVQQTVKRRFSKAELSSPYVRDGFAVYLKYGETTSVQLAAPAEMTPGMKRQCHGFVNTPITDYPGLLRLVQRLEKKEHTVTVYPDAAEFIDHQMMLGRLKLITAKMRANPAGHPHRETLLNVKLLPHQVDGIAFAAAAGRAILADDMGLGKTIQGIGVAELLAQECNIRRVLVICPASLKSQWRNEVNRFCGKSVQLVMGSAVERASQYHGDAFFTVCNYEQTLKDITEIEKAKWDLIILDEGQRIKNWEAKTTRMVKSLKSQFALVLTGTPLENRLDDLFSVMEFVDDRILGPAFRFFNTHRVVDENGKVVGYEALDELRQKLAPVLLRRTRAMVLKDLPTRTTEIVRVPATDEQLDIHKGHFSIISQIVRKSYLTEMDLLRLRKSLLACRMVADSSFLITKQPPGYSGKLKRLDEMLEELSQENDRKIVLFSEWTTMLGQIEPLFQKVGMEYVRLDGSVPQKKRQTLVNKFQNDPNCRAFLTTNAGSTGLNLQAANTVINVDLPWNPAVLEQRIARAHRMGQKNPVQVYLLVTEGTLEENLLCTLSAKAELALAALDMDSDVDAVSLESGMEELKRRLELLLGNQAEAPVDESQQNETREMVQRQIHQQKVAQAGGELLSAAFSFLNEMVPSKDSAPKSTTTTDHLTAQFKAGLSNCLEKTDSGDYQLRVSFKNMDALDSLAASLARLASFGKTV